MSDRSPKEECKIDNESAAAPAVMSIGGGLMVGGRAAMSIPVPQAVAVGAAVAAAGLAISQLSQKDCDVLTDQIQKNVANQATSEQQR